MPNLEKLRDEVYKLPHREIVELDWNWSEKFVRLLDVIGPLLLTLGILGIIIELKTPGFGVFGVVGLVLVGVFFFGKHTAGLAEVWEILLFFVGVVLLAVPAAYAVSIRPVEKTRDVLFFFMSTKMLPVVAVIVPIYVVAGRLQVLDNIWTLVILYTAMNLPLAVWMMRSFFQEVPREVLEAAQMDGANLTTTMRTILLPMVAPGVAATALLCVIFAWNEFFYAVQLNPVKGSTVPIWVTTNISTRGDFLAKLSAASVLACIPVVLAGWLAQKRMIRGLAMGAIK